MAKSSDEQSSPRKINAQPAKKPDLFLTAERCMNRPEMHSNIPDLRVERVTIFDTVGKHECHREHGEWVQGNSKVNF
jgi:hypothetical protein